MHANQAAPPTNGSDSGCGDRLRRAREAAGLRLEDVAERLKMPVRVVKSLEEEDWSRLGAPVFVRGQLRSYSRLLGLGTATTIEAAKVGPIEPPALVTHNYTPRHQRMIEQFSRRAAYIAITVAIVGSIWMGTRSHLSLPSGNVESLDVPFSVPAFGAQTDPSEPGPAVERTPLLATMAPTAPAAPALFLQLTDDSWVEVTGRDGRTLEQGLLPAGTTRSYDEGAVAGVVLGNAGAVMVERDGEPVDLSAYRRANVARFTVSSDGSFAPVAD